MSAEGYCRNGIHYVGNTDCWKCDLWEKMKLQERVFNASRRANALQSYTGVEVDQ